MKIIIRETQITDTVDICNLMNCDLGLGLSVSPDTLVLQISKMKAHENYIVNVAVYDNQIVGFIAAYKSMILEMPNEYMRIIGLSVARQYRRKGIGRRLMQSVVQYANENDIAYIALNTLPHVIDDHAFFEANGFMRKSVCYSKALK